MSSVIEMFYSEEIKEAKIDERNKLSSLYNKIIRENKNDDIKRIS